MCQRRHSLFVPSITAALAWVLLPGCVTYQTHQKTVSELEKAKELNADLIKQINKLGTAKPGEDPAAAALRHKLTLLERENKELKDRTSGPSFTPRQIKSVDRAEGEEGGIRFQAALLFNEGSADLKKDAFPVLDSAITMLRRDHPGESIIIEGHTDNQDLKVTKNRWEYNMRLGYMRADSVFRYFVEHGIPESRMRTMSYSYAKPIKPETADTEDGRRANRRVVIRLARAGV